MPSQNHEENMSKAKLIDDIAQRTGVRKKDVDAVLGGLEEAAKSAVQAAGEITIPGIGKIGTRQTEARTGRNPATGDVMTIPAKRVVAFKVARSLKDAANG